MTHTDRNLIHVSFQFISAIVGILATVYPIIQWDTYTNNQNAINTAYFLATALNGLPARAEAIGYVSRHKLQYIETKKYEKSNKENYEYHQGHDKEPHKFTEETKRRDHDRRGGGTRT